MLNGDIFHFHYPVTSCDIEEASSEKEKTLKEGEECSSETETCLDGLNCAK